MTVVLDQESMTYPRHLLADCDSALLLFCSGRMGAADGHWVREAGLTDVTCVDWDEKTLEPFAAEYPAEWVYQQADVFAWTHGQTRTWDLVSADAPSQHAALLPHMLPIYCSRASKYVVATMACYASDDPIQPAAPDGWIYAEDPIWRAEFEGRRFWWLVLERA